MARTERQKSVVPRWRVGVFMALCFVLLATIWGKSFVLQVLHEDAYSSLAVRQQVTRQELRGERGRIFFRDLSGEGRIPAAINNTTYDVILDPKQLKEIKPKERQTTVKTLASAFSEVSSEDIRSMIQDQNDRWALLKRNISQEKYDSLKQSNLLGVFYTPQANRIYPEEQLASHVLGFVQNQETSRKGQYGVEQAYQKRLAGKNGFEKKRTDTNGIWLSGRKRTLKEPQSGDDLVLTIDQTIQYQLEKTLQNLHKEYEPERSFGAIMNPQTGEIYAMSKRPTFNPNTYSEVDRPQVYRNPFISYTFEPGSIFKPLTMAIGVDTDSVTPETTYTDKAKLKIDGYTVQNVWDEPQGTQTMTNVLEKSLNTGVVFVKRQVGNSVFRSYLRTFNLDKPTGIDLPGEIAGDMETIAKRDYERADINFATASFGQGITVTPIRMLTLFSAIANEGKTVKPHVVDRIIGEDGTKTNVNPEDGKRLFSRETAQTVSEMLVSSVDNGFGEKAAVEGYRIGGKTGTSQKASTTKEGYGDDTVHSFIEFASLENPKYVMLLSLDEPKAQYSNLTVVPAAGELNRFLLNYFNMKPDRGSPPESDASSSGSDSDNTSDS